MKCTRCDTDYERMAGVQRFKTDYGYCSLVCLIADKPPCLGCGAVITPISGEGVAKLARRKYCSQHCAAVTLSSAPKSAETRKRMGESRRQMPPEHWQKIQDSIRQTYDADPERAARARARTKEGHRRWQSDSVAARQRAERYSQTMRKRGHYTAMSERMKAFYQTPEGEVFRQHVAQAKQGKPRPPMVRQKLRDALNAFWDTPDGVALRERLSEQRTDGLPDAPYGPGWARQAVKARSRDTCCVLCGATRATSGRVLDVHHIHARRKFGYIPGQNVNYRWANHLANLVTLCQSCHIRVEMKGAAVPPDYQSRADELWLQFIGLAH